MPTIWLKYIFQHILVHFNEYATISQEYDHKCNNNLLKKFWGPQLTLQSKKLVMKYLSFCYSQSVMYKVRKVYTILSCWFQ